MSNTGRKAVVAATLIFTLALALQAFAQQGSTPTGPTDPQIVGIVNAADQIDIDYANLALKKAQDPQVKAFAQQMATDHSAVAKAVGDLAGKLNVTPQDSPTADSLKAQAQQEMQKLQAMNGKDFDKAYINNEVAYHTAVINACKTVLIPSAQNPQLKDALVKTAPMFEGHLEHAQMVQSAIGGTAEGK